MRVLILHGWQGNDDDHWQTWLAERLHAREGTAVRYPRLPDCDRPCPDAWAATLRAELEALAVDEAGGERVVVCHSLACVLWLREARTLPEHLRPDRVLLVAPPCPSADVPELAGFYPTGADRDAVAAAAGETRLVCSDDDPYCPGTSAAVHWGEPLDLETEVLPGAAHLNVEAGYGPWPELLDWVLGARAYVGAKNGVET